MYKNKKLNNKKHVGADASVCPTSKVRQKNGITLIALIITIIVMLILVAVTISMAINGGLFEKAGEAVGDTKNEINKEQGLANGGIKIDGTYYNSIDEYLGAGVHDWTRTVDTFTCSHCNATYEMGQVVNYTANGEKTSTTISAEKSGLDKYYTANSNSYPEYANVDENGNQIIEAQNTKWVVLGIEDTNKDGKYETLLITSEGPVLATADKLLYFYGAAGYNNGASYIGADGKKVEGEIDRICRELYSNSEYGIARGMAIEDVNSCLNNPLQAMNLGGIYTDESSWHTTGNLTTKLKDVPVFSSLVTNGTNTPDGANTEEALGNYELSGYVYMLNEEGTNVAFPADESKTSPVTGTEKNTIFGSDENYEEYAYWLASRSVGVTAGCALFAPGAVGMRGVFSCGILFTSLGVSDLGTEFSRNLFRPVVSLMDKLPELKQAE